ncbi:MAG: hemolysin secretion protein D [Desulfatitalea sp. BRH_c12]|nr:MAG: hemolysin secretion protein D [Desulfatitalea sp. BRH_c12]
MKLLVFHRRTMVLIAILVPLLALFAYAAFRSGPLAPVEVATIQVEKRSIAPALFGIGIVEARFTYRIGPTLAGRVRQVAVHVGDRVQAGQQLGEIDPVDLDDRIASQAAALQRVQAERIAAEARLQDAQARHTYAVAQVERYEQLFSQKVVSVEVVEAHRQERLVSAAGVRAAKAHLEAAVRETTRISADRTGLMHQRANLVLIAPVDGLVVARRAEPGSTVVAGQSVVEMIDPEHIWVNVRFDQLSTAGLRAGLPAQIVLRSLAGQSLTGNVLRVEPLSDAVTEETLAKVVFVTPPATLPPIGELAEVTVMLSALPEAPVVPNAAVQRSGKQIGLWVVEQGGLRFAPVRLGAHDLDGSVQLFSGVQAGEQVVVYSQRALNARSRIRRVGHLQGVPQ